MPSTMMKDEQNANKIGRREKKTTTTTNDDDNEHDGNADEIKR